MASAGLAPATRRSESAASRHSAICGEFALCPQLGQSAKENECLQTQKAAIHAARSERLHRAAQSRHARLPTEQLQQKSSEVIGRIAARKAAVHCKCSEIYGAYDRVANKAEVPLIGTFRGFAT
ncbi:MAG: hypothetical protein ABJ263_09845 [Tateyamaria sp.]|uniref:hypothetical protein n=1 Tax=Tateyamaria sp. TaxID=1929288 RepID=UPI00328D956B